MTTTEGSTFYSAGDWVERLVGLVGSQQPVVFVVGAGLSRDHGGGVSTVAEILANVMREHPDIEPARGLAADEYQEVMGRLGARGLADQVIRTAVLRAYAGPPEKKNAALLARGVEQRDLCSKLQDEQESWYLPEGVTALAELLAKIEGSRRPSVPRPCVITTNFDGLIQIALRRIGVHASTRIIDDQVPEDGPDAISVWHVHRHWCLDGMRHVASALEAERSDVDAWLTGRFQGAAVCVIGYGGWKDIVFRVTSSTMKRLRPPPAVAWAFYESDRRRIAESCAHVLNAVPKLWSDSSHFFAGVDAHRDLPEVLRRLELRTRGAVNPPRVSDGLELMTKLSALLQAVIVATPSALRHTLDRFLQRPEQLNLCDVVQELCLVLKASDSRERDPFAQAAQALIEAWCDLLVETAGRPRIAPGRVVRVKVKTLLLIEILMARAQKRRAFLSAGELGTWNPRNAVLSDRLESGPTTKDAVISLKQLLWTRLFPTQGPYDDSRHWNNLRGRLKALGRLGEGLYVVISAGGSEFGQWNTLADQLPEVPFLHIENGESVIQGLDEYELAHLVSEFLRLAFPAEAR